MSTWCDTQFCNLLYFIIRRAIQEILLINLMNTVYFANHQKNTLPTF